eukprot:scaffold2693_cov139-Isochrysis_galbana.AAC.4
MVFPEPSDAEPCEFFVVVHAGAGYHAAAREAKYIAACRRACEAARARLCAGDGPLAAVTEAIAVLEDDPVCNAGTGSNLTLEGTVECDASVMDAESRAWGGVAAVAEVRNPVRVAALLASDQMSTGPLSCGRIRPVLLCGDGARRWAASRGLPTLPCGSAEMITAESRRRWRKYSEWVSSAASEVGTSARADATNVSTRAEGPSAVSTPAEGPPIISKLAEGPPAVSEGWTSLAAGGASGSEAQAREGRPSALPSAGNAADPCLLHDTVGGDLCLLHDTVGAVCCDGQMRVAAGVSSGGHWLKLPGRVGEAGCLGAGCWAARGGAPGSKLAVGVSVSGVGEAVMQGLVAKAAASGWASGDEPAQAALEALRGVDAAAAGLVGLICTPGPAAGVEVVWAHGTPSLALAYLHHGITEPVGLVSRTAGRRELVCGTHVKFARLSGGGMLPASALQQPVPRGLKRPAPETC